MKPGRTEESYLAEARALVDDLNQNLVFKKESYVPDKKHAPRVYAWHYLIIRRGMGTIATRRDPDQLVAFLRKELERVEAVRKRQDENS